LLEVGGASTDGRLSSGRPRNSAKAVVGKARIAAGVVANSCPPAIIFQQGGADGLLRQGVADDRLAARPRRERDEIEVRCPVAEFHSTNVRTA